MKGQLIGVLLSFAGMLAGLTDVHASAGIYESYVIIGGTYYDLFAATSNPDFSGRDFGTFTQGASWVINGGEIKTYKESLCSAGGNICGGIIFWEVKNGPSTVSSGSYTFSYNSAFGDRVDGCSVNQKWDKANGAVNLLEGLTAGMYTLLVNCQATGNNSGNSGCGDTFAQSQLSATFTVSAPVPVTWGTVEARAVGSKAQISWETLTETNNEHFAVERKSADQESWQPLGRIPGQGTSTQFRRYHFMDDAPAVGINYYRLRQVDHDGQFAFSRVVSVTVEHSGGVTLFPNPARDQLTLQVSNSESLSVVLRTMQGQLLKSWVMPAAVFGMDIPLDQIPQGTYLLQLVNTAGLILHTERLIRQ